MASILLLGNLNFIESETNTDESFVKDRDELRICADVLQVATEELEKALCTQVNNYLIQLLLAKFTFFSFF